MRPLRLVLRLRKDGRAIFGYRLKRVYSDWELERQALNAELSKRFGIENPESFVARSSNPERSQRLLDASLLQLDVDTTKKVSVIADGYTQHQQDSLQILLRFLITKDGGKSIITGPEKLMLDFYLRALPIFMVIYPDCETLGLALANHANKHQRIPHLIRFANEYPQGFCLNGIVTDTVMQHDSEHHLQWVDAHAVELARFVSTLKARKSLDREFCELLLHHSSAPAIMEGAL